MPVELGLDEASILVNKSSAIEADSIEVYYQNEECFGCPLEIIKRIKLKDDEEQIFSISTKHMIELEVRGIQEKKVDVLCHLNRLSLNNHALYRLDIQKNISQSTNGSELNNISCNLQTLDEGDCYLCPIALLLFVICSITVLEKLYDRWAQHRYERKQEPLGRVKSDETSEDITSTDRIETDEEKAANLQQEILANSVAISTSTMANTDDTDTRGQQQQQQQQQEQWLEVKSTTGNGAGSTRIESLDAFRGMTITGMILVNYGGAGYAALEHKAWDGLTLADLVFPFFVFSMGASIALSIKSSMKRGNSLQEILWKILKRSSILMLLGLCLNSKWLNDPGTGTQESLNKLRLTGVLQRLSVSYLIVATMYADKLTVIKCIKAQSLHRVPLVAKSIGVIFESLTAVNYIAIYLYFSFFFHYSDECPAGYLGPGGLTQGGRYANCTGGAAAWIDRFLLGEQHLYNDKEVKQIFKTIVSHDPEGILGYTTSTLLTLFGFQCGKILSRGSVCHKERVVSCIKWIILLALISLSAIIIPINKRLWSLSFVSVTGLLAFCLMTMLYLLMDVFHCKRTFLLRLLLSAGKNPILLYVGHSLLFGLLPWHFYVNETSHLQLLLRLVWSTLVWLLIAHYLAYKRLFIRV